MGFQVLGANQDLTLGVKGRHTMMVGVDFIHWWCVAPSDGLISQPVETVFAHCADAGFVKIEKKNYCDRDGNQGQHLENQITKDKLGAHPIL
jgi:hypothetical protein